MSKELKEALAALRTAADALNNLSDIIEQTLTEAAERRTKDEEADEAPTISMADLKAMLTKKSRAGYTKEVKALLAKYGSDKLSGIDESYYQLLYEEAEVIGNE